MFLITRAARLPGSIVTDLMATACREEKKNSVPILELDRRARAARSGTQGQSLQICGFASQGLAEKKRRGKNTLGEKERIQLAVM